MNKHKLAKAAKIVLVISLAFLMLYGISTPTFASMGSTGGGGGGGSAGGSGSSGGSYSGNGHFDWKEIVICFGMGIALQLLWWLCWKIVAILVDIKYRSHFFFTTFKYGRILLCQPPERSDFDSAFRQLKRQRKIKTPKRSKVSPQDLEALKETYIQAQFLYSQLIRRKLVNHFASLRPLKKYLDKHFFYKTMVKEIKLKCRSHEVDDTVIDTVEIEKIAQFGGVYVTKIKAKGQDKEIQFNHDFDASFSRSEWSDYVVFGKTRSGKMKIISLMYGEHAHLNGKDFNHDSSLDKNNEYQEQHYRTLSKKKTNK